MRLLVFLSGQGCPSYLSRCALGRRDLPVSMRLLVFLSGQGCPSYLSRFMLRGLQTTAGISPTGVHRDQEVSPTGTSLASRPGGLSYQDIACIETKTARQRIYETPSSNCKDRFLYPLAPLETAPNGKNTDARRATPLSCNTDAHPRR